MSADALLQHLQKVKRIGNGRWLACCPSHADKTASLSIRETDTARELLAEPDNRETGEHDTSALDDAKEFLQGLLAEGELPQKQIEIDAKGASHSMATVMLAARHALNPCQYATEATYFRLQVIRAKYGAYWDSSEPSQPSAGTKPSHGTHGSSLAHPSERAA